MAHRCAAVLLLVLGCNAAAPAAPHGLAQRATESHPTSVDAAASTASTAASTTGSATAAPATPPPLDDVSLARAIVERWNAAHSRRDADALRSLYAPFVVFYAPAGRPNKLSASECVKRKAAAFARTPDYTQAVRNLVLLPDGNGGVFASFSKVSTIAGASTAYDGYLYIDGGRIVAEGDGKALPTVRWNWCVHDIPLSDEAFLGVPRDEAIGGYVVSPLDAVASTVRSKHLADLRARSAGRRLKVVIAGQTGCPYLCAMSDPRGPMADPPCKNTQGEYSLRVIDGDSAATVEELKVDAMKKVLHWPGGQEPL